MSRRSARVANLKGALQITDGSDVDLDVDRTNLPAADESEAFIAPSDYEQDEETKNKPKGKKRKNTDNSAVGQPPNKKARGKRGMLSKLLDMPLDILFEIMGQLKPADLLNLTRTTRDLRGFFRSRQNEFLWKAARRNVPGLPPCPEDLSEPQYANLAFSKHCHACLRTPVALHTVWTARTKVCNKCLPIVFARVGWETMGKIIPQLRYCIPQVEIETTGKSRRRRNVIEYWHRATERRYSDLSSSPPKGRPLWYKDIVEAYNTIVEHSELCIIWADNYQTALAQDKALLVDNRRSSILQRLRDMGWANEINRMDVRALDQLKSLPALAKACHKDLSDKATATLLEILNEYMKDTQKARLIARRQALLKERIPVLEEVIKTYVLSLPVAAASHFPGFGDLYCHPVVRDIVNQNPDEEFSAIGLDPLRLQLAEIGQQVRSTIREKVIDLAAKTYIGNDTFDRDTVLNLATTIFSCTDCGFSDVNRMDSNWLSETLRFPDVMYHPCAVNTAGRRRVYRSSRSFTLDVDDDDIDFDYMNSFRGGQANWNRYSQITLKIENQVLLSEVISLAGFDPKTATFAEMDAADPIFECIACNKPRRGRATMRWFLVPAHNLHSHIERDPYADKENSALDLVLLGEEDSRAARARMDEEIEREHASDMYRAIACAHCHDEKPGGSVGIKKHVQTQHGIPHPTDDDIVHLPDKRSIEKVFYMWPPRPM